MYPSVKPQNTEELQVSAVFESFEEALSFVELVITLGGLVEGPARDLEEGWMVNYILNQD